MIEYFVNTTGNTQSIYTNYVIYSTFAVVGLYRMHKYPLEGCMYAPLTAFCIVGLALQYMYEFNV